LDADCWIPKADVSWDDHGIARHQLITGLNDYFKINAVPTLIEQN